MPTEKRSTLAWQTTLLGLADLLRCTLGRSSKISRRIASSVERHAANDDVRKLAAEIREENTVS